MCYITIIFVIVIFFCALAVFAISDFSVPKLSSCLVGTIIIRTCTGAFKCSLDFQRVCGAVVSSKCHR